MLKLNRVLSVTSSLLSVLPFSPSSLFLLTWGSDGMNHAQDAIPLVDEMLCTDPSIK